MLPSEPGVPFVHVAEVGDPESRIIEVVERESADLLVVQEKSRPWWGRVAARSLAERLILRAPCPVVVCSDRVEARRGRAERPPQVETPRHPAEVLDVLLGVLGPRVEAIVTWMDHQRDTVRRVAESPSVRHAVGAILQGGGGAFDRRTRRQLELALGEHQRATGAVGVNLSIQGASLYQAGVGAIDDASTRAFLERVQREGTAASLPLDADAGLPGGLVMLVGSRVRTSSTDEAALVFALDARRHFLRVLAQPGPTPSTETYAFDRTGLMLSNSRFPHDLRRLGLLPADPGLQAPRRIRVVEPAATSVTEVPDGQVGSGPLTRMAREATQGRDGSDWRGYSDYRGIEVVGVWRWIPEYEFGVAAEMDRPPPDQRRLGDSADPE